MLRLRRRLALLCLPALFAAAGPPPLVTGAVRDQFGDPISGARITADDGGTVTDAAGTFALETRASQVRISCDFCRSTIAGIEGDGTVVAIVERYHAIASQTLTQNDLRALPYARVQSAMSLQPFVVLADSSSILPGPRLSYYGLAQFGGLLVDDGIASYDIAAGVTPFRNIPAYDAAAFTTREPSDAFRYGDLASGGSFFVQTEPTGESAQGNALAGTQGAANVAQSTQHVSFNLANFDDRYENGARADASAQFPVGSDSVGATVLAAHDDITQDGESVSSSITGARVHYERTHAAHTFADFTTDRAQYTYSAALPIEGEWTDLSLQTGVSSMGKISTFAEGGVRLSAGYYDAASVGQPRIAGNIIQTHVSLGAQSQSGRLSWHAGIGAFNVSYRGGSLGTSTPNTAQIVTPSLSISYDLAPQWSVTAQANQSFRLPSLVEEYGYGADDSQIYFDRYGTQDIKLSYTDLRRLRISVLAMNSNVTLLDNGAIRATGASLGWQIAPELSLRAWTLHVDDASRPNGPVFRFGVPPQPATPASAWLTFENRHGFRADAIWRQDLLDYRADSHLDGSIGAPIASGLRWFIGTERRRGTRYLTVGIRLAQ